MSVANLERRIDWPQDLVDSSITDRFDWLIAYGEITVWRRCSAVSYNKRWRGEKERQQRRDLNQSKEVCTRLWHSLIPTYTFTFELKFIRHTVLHTSFRVLIYHFYVFTIFCFFFLILRHTHCTSITCFLQSPYLAPPLFDRWHCCCHCAAVCRWSVLLRSWQIAIGNALCCCCARFGDSSHKQITLLRRLLVIRHIRMQMPIYLYLYLCP